MRKDNEMKYGKHLKVSLHQLVFSSMEIISHTGSQPRHSTVLTCSNMTVVWYTGIIILWECNITDKSCKLHLVKLFFTDAAGRGDWETEIRARSVQIEDRLPHRTHPVTVGCFYVGMYVCTRVWCMSLCNIIYIFTQNAIYGLRPLKISTDLLSL